MKILDDMGIEPLYLEGKNMSWDAFGYSGALKEINKLYEKLNDKQKEIVISIFRSV